MDIAKLYRESFVENQFERKALFADLQKRFDIRSALYPGSFVHVTPSFFIEQVVYVDADKRAKRFFESSDLKSFLSTRSSRPNEATVQFIPADYREPLDLPDESFDLLISQYAGPISMYCKRYLKTKGLLLANNSHGDAGLASIDDDYRLVGVYQYRGEKTKFDDTHLDHYFVPRKNLKVTKELLLETGKGIGYTKTASGYLFEKS